MNVAEDIQIIGMSATIGNLQEVCRFLNADLYSRNFRPVELTEYVKCGNEIAKVNVTADKENALEVVRKTDFGVSIVFIVITIKVDIKYKEHLYSKEF